MNEQQGQQPIQGGVPGRPPGNEGMPVPVGAAMNPQLATAQARQTGPSVRRIVAINAIILVIILVIAAVIYYIWHQGYYFYSTDDAKVDGNIVTVASAQPGTIQTVYHQIGDTLHNGDTVVDILPPGKGASVVSITTPINGTIISQGAVVGEAIGAGTPVAQVVDLSNLYITAYVDENAISNIHPGQQVDVHIDAFSDTGFSGHIKQILPAAASTYNLLPSSDNASGNYTKVSQRIPVTITLDSQQGKALAPNMSAEITVHIH